MKTVTKKKPFKKSLSLKNETVKKNPFFEMIIEGLEKLEKSNWEHYLKIEINLTPKNLFTNLPYNRFNRFALMLDMIINNSEKPLYATFNQISNAGGFIKKGSKSIPLQYFSYTVKHKETFNIISLAFYKTLPAEQKENYFLTSFLKCFRVFNISCIDNINEINIKNDNNDSELENFEEINLSEKAEDFILRLREDKNLILHHKMQNKAFYIPSKDQIIMPNVELFKNDIKYYSTLFHELIHWTGNPNRLNRFTDDNTPVSKDLYAYEELVAEMGAMLVYFDYDFKEEFINSLVYLKGWLNNIMTEENKINILEKAFKESNKAVSFLYN